MNDTKGKTPQISDKTRENALNYQTIRYSRLTQQEINELAEAYEDVTGYALDVGCDSCIYEGFRIVSNYILYHEPKENKPEYTDTSKTKITEVRTHGKPNPEEQTLEELKETYPHIKAKTKEAFIKKLEQIRSGLVKIYILECRTKELVQMYEGAKDVPEGIVQIAVHNSELEEDEKIVELPGMYDKEQIEGLKEEIKRKIYLENTGQAK